MAAAAEVLLVLGWNGLLNEARQIDHFFILCGAFQRCII